MEEFYFLWSLFPHHNSFHQSSENVWYTKAHIILNFKALEEESITMGEESIQFQSHISNLENDADQLIYVIKKARTTGRWEVSLTILRQHIFITKNTSRIQKGKYQKTTINFACFSQKPINIWSIIWFDFSAIKNESEGNTIGKCPWY